MRRWRQLDEFARAISFRPTWFGARERGAQKEPRDYDMVKWMSENLGNVIDRDQTVPLTHLNRLMAERECRIHQRKCSAFSL